MSLLQALILGIVEGVTEFLPISSTGHLIIVEKFLQIPATDAVKSFGIIIQLGAIGAALLVYWRTFVTSRKTCMLVLAAFVPTAVVGLALHSFVKTYLLGNAEIVAWALFLGGIIMIVFEVLHRDDKATIDTVEKMSIGKAVLVGLFQTLSIVPGTSRSAATIIGGMSTGIRRTTMVHFSFLLAIPTMAAATGLDLLKSGAALSSHDALTIIVGFVTAFVTAYVSIRWLLRYVQSHTFIAFGVYRIVVAMVLWMTVLG